MPGERTMVGGDTQWLFNIWSDNPQLGAGHEPTAPNFVQQLAVYEIYTGQNAGLRDAATSILWLKAFGVTNISVPGPDTRETLHPFVNPFKFDGLLPVLWREDGDTVYGVPMPSRSLAHVIPAEAIVVRAPANGLDIAARCRLCIGSRQSIPAPGSDPLDQPFPRRHPRPHRSRTSDLRTGYLQFGVARQFRRAAHLPYEKTGWDW